ncbi:IS3 family transposase [Bacillaceae bacterium W0354]
MTRCIKKKECDIDYLFRIANKWILKGFFIKRILDILNLHRSTYYDRTGEKEIEEYQAKRGRPCPGYSMHEEGHKISDEQIEEYLMEYYLDDNIGALGYKKWTTLLREQYNLIINKKKIYRICKALGILKERKIKKPKHKRKLAKNRVVTGPNQLWQVDIKYGNIENSNNFIFLCCAIDVYDRKIVGAYRGSTCKAKDITTMLTKALIKRKVHFKEGEFEDKLIIRTDNGPQFVSEWFGDFCCYQKIYHERIPNKTPNMNAYIESFHSQVQRECFDRHSFTFYDEAYYYIDEYIHFYNHTRPHGSLGDSPPEKYFQLTLDGRRPIQIVNL